MDSGARANISHKAGRELALWHRGTLALAVTVAPVAGMVWWSARNLPGLPRLLLKSGSWDLDACMFLRYGLGASLRAEACRYAPPWARPFLTRVAGWANLLLKK